MAQNNRMDMEIVDSPTGGVYNNIAIDFESMSGYTALLREFYMRLPAAQKAP